MGVSRGSRSLIGGVICAAQLLHVTQWPYSGLLCWVTLCSGSAESTGACCGSGGGCRCLHALAPHATGDDRKGAMDAARPTRKRRHPCARMRAAQQLVVPCRHTYSPQPPVPPHEHAAACRPVRALVMPITLTMLLSAPRMEPSTSGYSSPRYSYSTTPRCPSSFSSSHACARARRASAPPAEAGAPAPRAEPCPCAAPRQAPQPLCASCGGAPHGPSS